jgi:hypothetical protein
MWRTSTRVLKSTACLMAVLCFVFVRTTALAAQGGESSIKACGEILNVCISGAPTVLLEGKPNKVSRIDSSFGARIFLKPVDAVATVLKGFSGPSRPYTASNQRPLWLMNRAILI